MLIKCARLRKLEIKAWALCILGAGNTAQSSKSQSRNCQVPSKENIFHKGARVRCALECIDLILKSKNICNREGYMVSSKDTWITPDNLKVPHTIEQRTFKDAI